MNNIQGIIERSVFELINQTLASEGYWPLYNSTTYPNTPTGLADWDLAVKAVATAKGFAAQPFGYGAPQSKGDKKVPRIAIITRRFNPGNIGNPVDPQTIQNTTNPDSYIEIIRAQETLDQQMEVHVIADNADQERILNAIVYQALGSKGYVPFTGRPGLFFLRQYNHYDLPDPQDSLIEKVFCYEVADLYLKDDVVTTPVVPLINEITMEVVIGEAQPLVNSAVLPPTVTLDGTILIDLSHIRY